MSIINEASKDQGVLAIGIRKGHRLFAPLLAYKMKKESEIGLPLSVAQTVELIMKEAGIIKD